MARKDRTGTTDAVKKDGRTAQDYSAILLSLMTNAFNPRLTFRLVLKKNFCRNLLVKTITFFYMGLILMDIRQEL
jgi:hypothetical protein